MLLLRLWNYIRGYVIILVEGHFIEKFINICIRRQIFLWDIKKHKTDSVKLKVSIKGFKLLRPVAKKTKTRVKLVRKRGIPFVLHKYKGRKTFAVGAFIFVLLFYVMSSFIWKVEISGAQKVDTNIILQCLKSAGVKPGSLKYNVDTNAVVNKLMLDVKELSWASVVVKGTKVKVEVAEAVNKPPLLPKNVPCNVMATKDGVIKSIVAKEGQEMVKIGDTVKKGQILISGIVETKNQEVKERRVHAFGEVTARTWYEGTYPVNTVVPETVKSGKSKRNYSLVLFNKQIKLFHSKSPFENYDKIEINKRLSIGEDLVFPFEFRIDRYDENLVSTKEITLDEAKKDAEANAYKEATKDIPENATVVKSNTSFIENQDGSINASVVIECIENIGQKVEIGGT